MLRNQAYTVYTLSKTIPVYYGVSKKSNFCFYMRYFMVFLKIKTLRHKQIYCLQYHLHIFGFSTVTEAPLPPPKSGSFSYETVLTNCLCRGRVGGVLLSK